MVMDGTRTMTHTAGPWMLNKNSITGPWIIEAGDLRIASSHPVSDDNGEEDANARLIAAAPDLLDAARTALASAEEYAKEYPTGQDAMVAEILRDAITKATGGE